MAYEHIKTEELAKEVRTRNEFLDIVTNRVIDLVRKYGEVTKRDEGNNHTNIVSNLCNFGSFTFETDLGQIDFGGNTVRVWHHPGKNFQENSVWSNPLVPVLDVYFQTTKDYAVSIFNHRTGWQKALINLLKNRARIAAQIKKTQNKTLKTRENQEQSNTEKIKLIKEAQKLRIIPEEE